MALLKIPGVPFNGNGTTVILAPIALSKLRQLLTRVKTINSNGLDPDSVQVVIDAVQASLARNYENVTEEFVCDLLDSSNMRIAMDIIMNNSGMQIRDTVKEIEGKDGQNGFLALPT